MRFAKQTYRMYKDMVPQQAQDNMQLIRLHMKMCMKHYHALLPQLDIIDTQWGISIDDTLAQDDEGSLRSEAARQRRTTTLDNQLREQIRDVRKTQVRERDRNKEGANEDPEPQTSRLFSNRKSSAAPHSEEIQSLSNQAREEIKKRRTTEASLCKAEEDLRLLRQQLKANVTSSESQGLGAPDPPSSTDSHLTESLRRRVTPARDSVSSNFLASSGPSDVGSQLLQVLREAAGQGTGYGNRNTQLTEDYPDGHTVRTFYMSLADPWSIIPSGLRSVKRIL
jgi:hypothetical protein